MASQLTEYERRRLENIKRNDEMMASLKIQSKLSEISTAKRQRVEKCKSFRIDPPRKEEKSNSPVVIRRSPRTRGHTPDSIKSSVKLPKPTVPSDSSDAISQTQGSLGPGFIESLVELREPLPQYIAPRPRGRPRKVVPSDVNAISPTQGSQGPGFLEPSVELVEPLPRVLGSIRFRDSCSIDSESDARALTEAILSVSSSSSGSSIGEANGVRVQNGKASKRGISNPESPPPVLGPLRFRDSCSIDSELEVQAFTKAILSVSSSLNGSSFGETRTGGMSDSDACKLELDSLSLEPANRARVVPGNVYAVKFFPTHDLEMVVAGGYGHVGFWDMKSSDEVNCIHLYRPHSGFISGILVHPFSMSKVYTSSSDGMLRVMNIDKQVFDLVYSSDDSIYALAQKPDDVNSIYFSEGQKGVVKMWDERIVKTSASWNLHEMRINSIDFNSANTNMMATSSSDGNICIWDLRKLSAQKPVMLKAIERKKAVHSACFSPSGIHLAAKRVDGKTEVVSGKNYEDVSVIYHDNCVTSTTRTYSFRAIWGWDDTHLFVGGLSGGVDILSVGQKRRLHTLRSKHITSSPCMFDAHPWKAGALAGASRQGLVYVWTPPSDAISQTHGSGFLESLVVPTEQITTYRPRGRPRKLEPSDVNAISPTQGSQGPGFLESSVELVEPLPRVLVSIRFRDSCSVDSESDVRALTEAILSVSSSSSGSLIGEANGVRVQNRKASKRGISNSDCKFKLESLRLEPNNIARVVPGQIYAMKFFPTHDLKMVVVGNGFGDVGFWDMKSSDEVNCIHLHRLHSAAVSGILVHPFSMSKVYTSSIDGDVRVMNIEKQVFDLVYSNDDFIYSLAQKPDDTNSVYFGAGQQEGVVKSWDERMGKTSASWNLHEKRINSIDFNSANTNIMATSSTDGTACVWDLRKMSAENSAMLKVVEHKKSVGSAYFSPSGIHLASKSVDGNIGVISGKNFEDVSMILHDKNMGRSASCFRAVWGWDDTHLYVGSVSRGVDVVSVAQKARIYTLRSKHVTSIPCWLDAHPWKAGALAAAAIGVGMVYVWTPPS